MVIAVHPSMSKVWIADNRNDGERTGLIVMGLDYAYLSVEKKQDGLYISQTLCQNADKGSVERETAGS
jgi:hypothetical protein